MASFRINSRTVTSTFWSGFSFFLQKKTIFFYKNSWQTIIYDMYSINITQQFPEANRMMRVAKELPNSSTLSNLGSTALYLIATLPDDEKQEQIEKIEQGESPTVRELQEIKRRLKLKDQALEAVKGELERVKQTKTTEKIIEKEVVPQDYKATQDLNKQLLGKNKDLADELDSVKRSLRLKEASYEMLEKETYEKTYFK